MLRVSESTAASLEGVLQGADYCATVTAGALRTVGALRAMPGANFLLKRSKLCGNQKLVPGYASLKSKEDFAAQKKAALDKCNTHPVQHEADWAARNMLRPICASLVFFRALLCHCSIQIRYCKLITTLYIPY
jgi:hypothetical protein